MPAGLVPRAPWHMVQAMARVAPLPTEAGPGSVIFLTGTDPHGLRNAGTNAATYHVLAWRSPGGAKGD